MYRRKEELRAKKQRDIFTRQVERLLNEMEQFTGTRRYKGTLLEAWALVLRAVKISEDNVDEEWFEENNF